MLKSLILRSHEPTSHVGQNRILRTSTKALFQSREINFSSYFLATFSHL
jgi:hypothetical protein